MGVRNSAEVRSSASRSQKGSVRNRTFGPDFGRASAHILNYLSIQKNVAGGGEKTTLTKTNI